MRPSLLHSSIALVLIISAALYFSLLTSFGKRTVHEVHNSIENALKWDHAATDTTSSAGNPYTGWFVLWQDRSFSHTLVVASMKTEDTSWVDDELSDLNITKAVYVVDDELATLNTPVNKGNEAMVYLTYIIDFYDELPDVSTFMHAHSTAWHNNELFESSSVEILRRLSLEKVNRDGYVNLRCDWEPGCPVLYRTDRVNDGDTNSHMNKLVGNTIQHLFPERELPQYISQPCCAQFSLSRTAITSNSKEFYTKLRQWLIDTDLPNSLSGRIFESIWHYIFTSEPVFCPNAHICYCDTFAICFPDTPAYDQYNGIVRSKKALELEKEHLPSDQDISERQEKLQMLIDGLQWDMEVRRQEAFQLGSDIGARRKILHDSWEGLRSSNVLA